MRQRPISVKSVGSRFNLVNLDNPEILSNRILLHRRARHYLFDTLTTPESIAFSTVISVRVFIDRRTACRSNNNLVLKNTRVPTLRVDSYFFTPFIQTFNTNIQRAIHDRLVAVDAKATFEKLC